MAPRKCYYRADDHRPGSGYVVKIADERLTLTFNELLFCARIIQAYRILGSSREEAEQVALTKLKELRKVKHISSPKQD